MVRSLKDAFEAEKISRDDYHKCLSDYVDVYNGRFGKDIDSSFVENKLRAETTEINESEDYDDEAIDTLSRKDNVMISRVISNEGAE